MRSLYGADAVYPPPSARRAAGEGPADSVRARGPAYLAIELLRRLDRRQRSRLEYVGGHFPYCAGQLFDRPVRYVTFFRDPVARTSSHLKQARTLHPEYHGWSLQRLYEDREFHRRFISNLQTRCFAHELTDELSSVFDPRQLTEADFRLAKRRVASLDFLGILEDYGNAVQLFKREFNLPNLRITKRRFQYNECDVPQGLPARIAADNAYDMELYGFAKSLYQQRLHASRKVAA
jgi:hypothetical protein